jgi:hypothetical protein
MDIERIASAFRDIKPGDGIDPDMVGGVWMNVVKSTRLFSKGKYM